MSDQCVADESAEANRQGNNDGVKSGADKIEAENDEVGETVIVQGRSVLHREVAEPRYELFG